MNSKHALFSVVIATALASVSTAARADDTANPNNPSNPSTDTSPNPSQAPKQDATKRKATSAGKAKQTKQPEPLKKKVEKTVKESDTTARKANEAVVGPETQAENEARARDSRARAQAARDARKTGEAVGRTTTTAAEVVADASRFADPPGPYAPFAIEVNPLGLIVGGRWSATAEWAPVTHHVILASPHFIHTSQDVAINPDVRESQTFTGVGGELGYRYYTGHRGMNGVFIGPSLIGGVYNASLPGGDQAFTNYGIAADVGLKGLVADHLALGGGIGLEYLHVSHEFGDVPTGAAAIASTGFKPRLIFEAGYAF
jgi:hypothetical protein